MNIPPNIATGAAMAASQGADEDTRIQEAELAKKLSEKRPKEEPKIEDKKDDRAWISPSRLNDLLTPVRLGPPLKKPKTDSK